MSTEVATPEELEAKKAAEQSKSETVSRDEYESLVAKLEQSQSSNDRLLGESKDNKAKYQSMRKQQEDAQKEDMESKEQWKELLEKERNEKFELESDLKASKKRAVLKEIHFQAAKHAPDAQDIDILINSIPLTEDMIDKDTGEVSGLSGVIDELRKNKPFLFKKDVPNMRQDNPGYVGAPPEKDFSKLKPAEQDLLLTKDLEKLF